MSYSKEYYTAWKEKNAGKLKAYEKQRSLDRSASEEWRKSHSDSCKRSNHKLWKSNPAKALWSRAKYRATHKGLEFNIDIEDIIIPEYCPLLETKFELGITNNRQTSMSLDRIDPSKGYVKGNVWVISTKANVLKNNATKEELITFANNVIKIITPQKDPKELSMGQITDVLKELT